MSINWNHVPRVLAIVIVAAGLFAIAWVILSSDSETGDPSNRAAQTVDNETSGADEMSGAIIGQSTGTGSGTSASSAGSTSSASKGSSATAIDESSQGDSAETKSFEPIPYLGAADTLTGLDGWLNTDAASLEEIRSSNRLTVVQFWTFGCYNCKKTLNALSELYADYHDEGIEIIGVHSPEFSYEADVDNIIAAADELGVTWPIALDTDKRNFHRWQEGPTGYWPRVYVIDSDNQIRYDKRGDGVATYRRLREIVKQLLTEA